IPVFATEVDCLFVSIDISGNSCLFVGLLGVSSLAIAFPRSSSVDVGNDDGVPIFAQWLTFVDVLVY
nr:hypothetical protein [Tanacetum cinerariifolium]